MATEKTEEELEVRPYHYMHQQVVRNVHHFYISSVIEEAFKYADMIFKIQTAGPEDIVYMHLNTIGGYMDAGIQLMNAMNSTQAHVIAALEGEVASMGTFVFLAADEFIVHENSSMMIHNYTGGVFGKGHEQIAALESATVWSRDFMHRTYIPFLTEDEVDRVIAGEDIYMHPPEIRDRLEKMVQIMQEEQDAIRAAVDAPQPVTPKSRTAKKKASKKKVPAKKKT